MLDREERNMLALIRQEYSVFGNSDIEIIKGLPNCKVKFVSTSLGRRW